eukprot:3622402-Amphidinium_carterae.1
MSKCYINYFIGQTELISAILHTSMRFHKICSRSTEISACGVVELPKFLRFARERVILQRLKRLMSTAEILSGFYADQEDTMKRVLLSGLCHRSLAGCSG